MTPNEQTLIEELFARIRNSGAAAQDSEAAALIGRLMAQTPTAAYTLAQTVIVQDQALRAADARIKALEAAGQQTSGNASGSFLGGAPDPQGHWNRPSAPQGPWAADPGYPRQQFSTGGVGSFLGGALQTAAGVAGGALLFDGIRSLLGGGGGGGFGGGAFGGEPEVIEQTIINNYDDQNDQGPGDNPNIVNADWSDDNNDDDGGDDSSWA